MFCGELFPPLAYQSWFNHLQDISARRDSKAFFVNTISLLPGTLSADIQDDNVTIHIIDIDTPFWPNIHNLEWRIAYLFKIIPSPKEVG